ncbi:MAG: S8 family serine peptidase [Candidatus Eisenbacteria bacterium]
MRISPLPCTGLVRLAGSLIACSLLGFTTIAFADPEPFADASSWIPRHFQVEVLPGQDIHRVASDHGLVIAESFGECHLLVSSGEMEDAVYLDDLQADSRLDWAELAYWQHTPESTRQMVVAVVGATVEEFATQNVYDHIGLGELHAHTLGAGTVVAVIDTGVDVKHPAISEHIVAGGYDFIGNDQTPWETRNHTDDDEDGLVDEAAGHGTMVAGIVSLVAPEAGILPIRALDDDGNGTAFGVARAINYATAAGVDVINLSLGLPQFSMVIERAVQQAREAGVIVVAAAGNEGTDEPPYFPASSTATLSVASLDAADIKSDFSNYDETVSLSAPGERILAPYIDGEWAVGSGTSFAAPFISGQAALVRSVLSGLGVASHEAAILSGTIRVDQLIDNLPYEGMLGAGRIDGKRTWHAVDGQMSALTSTDATPRGEAVWTPNPLPAGRTAVLEFLAPTPEATEVALSIVDATGRNVRTMNAAAGERLEWDGTTETGVRVPAGIYFGALTLSGPDGTEAGRTYARILVVN